MSWTVHESWQPYVCDPHGVGAEIIPCSFVAPLTLLEKSLVVCVKLILAFHSTALRLIYVQPWRVRSYLELVFCAVPLTSTSRTRLDEAYKFLHCVNSVQHACLDSFSAMLGVELEPRYLFF